MSATEIYSSVQSHYSSVSHGTKDGKYETTVATAFGYTPEELASIPKESNLGLSCGNPTAIANLREGEVVIDLGSGAGFDVFLAAKKVGASGRAIGVDRNKDMLRKAEINRQKARAENVSFVDAPLTAITPLETGAADCIISNCVINLVPDAEKQIAFNEMARLLKPGGRVAISDILLKKPLPDHMREDMALYVGCIAGASRVQQYEEFLRNAGFENVVIVDSESDLNVYSQDGGSCCAPKQKSEATNTSTGTGTGTCQPTTTKTTAKTNGSSCCTPKQSNSCVPKQTADSPQQVRQSEKSSAGCCGPKKSEPDVIQQERQQEKQNEAYDNMSPFSNVDFNEYAGSYKIFAVLPQRV